MRNGDEVFFPKFFFAKILIWDNQYFLNPQKSFLDPKIHIFDPRTPKFGILVQNGVTICMFFKFLKNAENWPFFRFLTIFGIFARRGVRKSPITLKLVSKIFFFCVFSEYAKISKIWFRKNLGWSPPLPVKKIMKLNQNWQKSVKLGFKERL